MKKLSLSTDYPWSLAAKAAEEAGRRQPTAVGILPTAPVSFMEKKTGKFSKYIWVISRAKPIIVTCNVYFRGPVFQLTLANRTLASCLHMWWIQANCYELTNKRGLLSNNHGYQPRLLISVLQPLYMFARTNDASVSIGMLTSVTSRAPLRFDHKLLWQWPVPLPLRHCTCDTTSKNTGKTLAVMFGCTTSSGHRSILSPSRRSVTSRPFGASNFSETWLMISHAPTSPRSAAPPALCHTHQTHTQAATRASPVLMLKANLYGKCLPQCHVQYIPLWAQLISEQCTPSQEGKVNTDWMKCKFFNLMRLSFFWHCMRVWFCVIRCNLMLCHTLSWTFIFH